MSIGVESVVIGVLVAGALAWALRAGYRSVRHTGGCSSCSSSGDCPLAKNPEALAELARMGKTTPLDPCHPHDASCAELLESVAPRPKD